MRTHCVCRTLTAYDIRIAQSYQEMAGTDPRRDRGGVLGVFAAALLHRRHAGSRDICIALSAAGRPRDVRERGDGGRGGPDLAAVARPPPRAAPPGWAGLRLHGDPGGPVRDGDRGGHAVRSVPGREQCLPGLAMAMVHGQRLSGGAAAALRRPSASDGSERDAGAVHHHQPDLDAGAVHCPAPIAGQPLWRQRGTLSVVRGRPGCLVGLDGSLPGRAAVVESETSSGAVVNFPANGHAAG
jgi:hypothetical protein